MGAPARTAGPWLLAAPLPCYPRTHETTGLVRDRGTLDLQDGVVSDNPIGANVQTEDFDIGRLQDRVAYRDNDRNLDAAALPVPEPLDVDE